MTADEGIQDVLADFSATARNHVRSLRDGTRTVSLDGRSDGDTVRVRSGRSLLTARIVERFDAWALRDRCRDEVAAALARAGIDHLGLDSPQEQPHRVIVSAADAHRVPDALSPLAARPELHVAPIHGTRRSPARPLSRLASVRPGDVVRIFSAQVSRAGRLLPTADLGVDLEVWEQVSTPRMSPDGPLLPTGSLVAPRTNSHARFLPPEALTGAPAPGACAPLEQVTFPIDIVYTWVDADDPDWQADFAAARRGDDDAAAHTSARSSSRFTSREELRYSLRSVAAYAGWVRRIHIVTNGQVPAWLDTDHPQIHLVHHAEIFPDRTHLPTFNSHAIEANLHRIPGLAQHYLYLNDDVFLARPLRPEQFFTASGLLRYFPSMIPVEDGAADAADLPVVAAFKNGRRIIEDRFGRRPMTRPRHTPHPQRRDVLEEIDAACPEVVERTSASRFRHPSDVSLAAQLQAFWAAATGRAVPADTRYEFIDIGDPGSDRRIDRMLVRSDLDSYCLNETHTDDPALAQQRVDRIVAALLPFPSPYER
ncbi:stealth conserved region 3 domain-containing protein [Janibacter limosus]|uniref:stealth conserved region 3 domain-containing protein n=1 Tax=Janibacter limosus TaxID=53458 RepID=UPI00082DD09B|nr:stealth conserved region 3 domain-containing protein [Janibacter limosus]